MPSLQTGVLQQTGEGVLEVRRLNDRDADVQGDEVAGMTISFRVAGLSSALMGLGVFLLVRAGWHPAAFTPQGAILFLYHTDDDPSILSLAALSGAGAAIIAFGIFLLKRN